MIRDAWTVMRKDLQELRSLRSQGLSGIISTLLILIIFGVIVPWRFDVGWDAHPASPLLWVWLPWLPAAVVVADTFAGERERHTLDALYVTRLSNDAILLGKVGAAALFVWLVALLTLALSAAILAITGSAGSLSLNALLPLAALSLLSALLAATLGAMASLRSSSARHAQQSAIAAVLSLTGLLIVIGQAIAQYRPTLWHRMMHAGVPESFTAPKWLLAFAALVLIEIALLALAARCVGHSRLGLS